MFYYMVLYTNQVIAMTCTHAALKRHDLIDLGFQYDNIIMEEAAQILEIETFIPYGVGDDFKMLWEVLTVFM